MDIQVLQSVSLFDNLDAVQLAHIASITTERLLRKGDVVFREGDVAGDFYIVKKGKVRISKVVPGMGEEALAILPQGAYFGEMELIEGSPPRAAQATAHEDCILQTFTFDDFHTLLSTDKELAVAILWNFVRTLSNRLRESNDKIIATFAMAQFQ